MGNTTLVTVPVKALFSLLALFRNFVGKMGPQGFSDLKVLSKVNDRLPKKPTTLLVFYAACAMIARKKLTEEAWEAASEFVATAMESKIANIRLGGAILALNLALNPVENTDEEQVAVVCALTEAL